MDRLVIVPTGEPVHKSATFFNADIRHQMLKSVFGDNEMIDISDVETKKVVHRIALIQYHHFGHNISQILLP